MRVSHDVASPGKSKNSNNLFPHSGIWRVTLKFYIKVINLAKNRLCLARSQTESKVHTPIPMENRKKLLFAHIYTTMC